MIDTNTIIIIQFIDNADHNDEHVNVEIMIIIVNIKNIIIYEYSRL